MKLVHTIVSTHGLGRFDANGPRLGLLDELVRWSTARGARLLVLPGGFLHAIDERHRAELIRDVAAGAHALTIVGGVDLEAPVSRGRNQLGAARAALPAAPTGTLPGLGFAVGPGHGPPALFQQVSTRASDAAPGLVPAEERIVQLGEARAAVLLGGEIYSRTCRAHVAALAPALIIDCGHDDMSRVAQAMTALGKLRGAGGAAIVVAQHLDHEGVPAFHDAAGGAPAPAELELLRHPHEQALWSRVALREI